MEMHDSMMTSGGMGHEQQQIQENGYGNNDGWVDINYTSPQHHSPMFEQGGFGFLPQAGHHGMPMEPIVYSPRLLQPAFPHSHQQLLPIITNHPTMHPAPTWPSELTNPAYSSPPPPISMPARPPPVVKGNGRTKSPTTKSTAPRRTLTDADRREMCVLRAKHPEMKQVEIGDRFGIERSTVSKVLRNKEKYMCPDDRSLSPVKRTKSKFPDIDKGLAAWVKNQNQLGKTVTDTELRHMAQHFARNSPGGAGGEITHKFQGRVWLEKFKQKTGLKGGKLSRRASLSNIADNGRMKRLGSTGLSVSHPVNETAPTSPTLLASTSPISDDKTEDDVKIEGLNDFFFPSESGGRYKHINSQSTDTLASTTFTDQGPFSAGPTSPSTPFSFSPDNNSTPPWNASLHIRSPSSSAFQRPRSQTFPMIGVDPTYIPTQSNEPLTPKYLPVTAPSSALDSPMSEMAPPYGMDSAMSSPYLHHSSSNGSMGPPTSGPNSGSTITGLQSPPNSSTNSPTTQDDARRALDTLLAFFQQAPTGLVDQNDYQTVLNLTEKLRITQNTSTLPGGLHRIAEQDCEIAPKMEHSMSAGC